MIKLVKRVKSVLWHKFHQLGLVCFVVLAEELEKELAEYGLDCTSPNARVSCIVIIQPSLHQ